MQDCGRWWCARTLTDCISDPNSSQERYAQKSKLCYTSTGKIFDIKTRLREGWNGTVVLKCS